MTAGEMRSEMKKRGQLPPRTFSERNLLISSTSKFTSLLYREQGGTAQRCLKRHQYFLPKKQIFCRLGQCSVYKNKLIVAIFQSSV